MGLVACKRTKDPEPKEDSRADQSRDSIYLYAKQIYLWNDALPTYESFNPRRFTYASSDLLNYEQELYALAKIAKNPASGLAYEYYTVVNSSGINVEASDSKYSYIVDKADKNPIAYIPATRSAVNLEGDGNDFGLKLSAYGQGGDTFALFVTAVYQNSPADKLGMIRSDRIYKINGRAIGSNFDNDIDFINSAINGDEITIEGVHYKNGISDVAYTQTLKKTVYKSSPVLSSKVFTEGSKKIGYLVYARFSTLANSKTDLDAAFTTFKAAGVTDLIIDLRYNGGGYVSTAEYLINQIAPKSADGKLMLTEHYNSLMQSGKATILSKQPYTDASGKILYGNDGKMLTFADLDYSVAGNTKLFSKLGLSFNTDNSVNNVVFIVTKSTASASELVINSLKPYMNVTLVGTQTYGKPIGFFPITIENKYEVFYSMFQTKNSLGEGDYFSGLNPTVFDDFDDPRNNFGDSKEHYTSVAIGKIPGTGVGTFSARTMSIQGRDVAVESLQPMKPIVHGNEFVGMIENRHTLKRR